jgi:hypothetical protein
MAYIRGYYLSGENREKLLSVGITPVRLLYDMFLQQHTGIKKL